MKKLYYELGKISRYISLRFAITTKTARGFCIAPCMNDDAIEVRNLYPTLTVITTDEIRDESRRWTPERNFSLSRFTSVLFVKKAKTFIRRYVEEQKLFRYVDGVLTVDKDIARKIAFKADVEFNTRILVLPVVAKDQEIGQLYEGVAICVRDMSNHTIMTYDEFVVFVEYVDKFHFDLMAIKLLTLAIATYGLQKVTGTNNLVQAPDQSLPPIVEREEPTIPKLN